MSLAELREPFDPSQVGSLPRGGTTLDFVGHGAVTARLLDVDPEWNWQPAAVDEQGSPVMEIDGGGNPVGFWITLTVLGVTRYGYGSCPASQFEAEKVLIGDAIRNAAMRFGVALDLWIKGHAEDDERVSASTPSSRNRGPRLCVVCEKPITGKAVNGGGGYAHEDCVKTDQPRDEEPF